MIVDIGSDSVGGSVVLLSKNNAPKILYGFRSTIVWHDPPEKGRFLSDIKRALEHVVKNITGHGLRYISNAHNLKHIKIHRAHFIFSAPWYVSQAKVFKIDREPPFLVNQDFVDKLFKDEIQKFTDEAQNKVHSQIFQNLQIVEKRIIRTRLNGYETPDPFGKKANHVEITFFISLISKDILDSVRDIVGGHFHITHTEISSVPLAAFNAFSGLTPNAQDFLILDVRGEVTDVSIVHNGALVESVSFSQGKNALIRSVAEGSQQSFNLAASSLNIALHGKGTTKFQTDTNKFTDNFKNIWLDSYIKTVKDLALKRINPRIVFLVGDMDTEVFFENCLKNLENPPEVHPLKRADLRKYVDISSVFSDPFLALETIFVSQL